MNKLPGWASGAAIVKVVKCSIATMMNKPNWNFIVDCCRELLIEAMGGKNWIRQRCTEHFYRVKYKFLSYHHNSFYMKLCMVTICIHMSPAHLLANFQISRWNISFENFSKVGNTEFKVDSSYELELIIFNICFYCRKVIRIKP